MHTAFDNINDTGLARSVEDWTSIFTTQTDGTPQGVARRIISDLWGYNSRSGGKNHAEGRYYKQDAVSLANALVAAQMFNWKP